MIELEKRNAPRGFCQKLPDTIPLLPLPYFIVRKWAIKALNPHPDINKPPTGAFPSFLPSLYSPPKFLCVRVSEAQTDLPKIPTQRKKTRRVYMCPCSTHRINAPKYSFAPKFDKKILPPSHQSIRSYPSLIVSLIFGPCPIFSGRKAVDAI